MITAQTKITLPALYPKQRAIFFTDAKTSICDASTKSGKTRAAIVWLIWHGIERAPGHDHLWVSPVYAQALKVRDRFIRLLTRSDPTKSTGWDVNKTENWLRLPGGAKVWFKGGDNADAIYGSDYAAGVIDEASRCPEETYHAVVSTLTATDGPLRIIGNVKGRKNWAFRLAQKARSGVQGMEHHRLVATDAVEAGVLKQSVIDDAERLLPRHVFRELYFAEPSDDGGNPFGLDKIDRCLVEPEYAGGEVVVWGVDLAKSHDWTVVVGLDADGFVAGFERWQGPWNLTVSRLSAIIGETPALVDSTGVGDAILEQLQRVCPLAEGFKFSSPSKQQLMEGLASSIHQERTRYADGILAEELRSFEYQLTAGGNVRYSAPDGLYDDCVCALALAVRRMMAEPEIAYRSPPRTPAHDLPLRVAFDRMRQNPDWGFSGD